ncbi:hypothetical protein [Leisingera sp. ANG-Vp]|uniref:hypothetical protein n=1 Tax=Leisingera sp. ANG-Vp TaxID=1577896 RepID=UPI00057E41D1|nr:hypothetical protein [Leisingera sp. ANG-Vp]KIC14493.1 hypothetical protein RA20_20510 [Leisingera sp. ANG-Vp]
MKLSSLVLLPLALAASGCMQYAPVDQPPVAVAFKTDHIASRVTGYTEPVVRTFFFELNAEERKQLALSGINRSNVSNDRTEVAGVACTLDSAEFSASFTTPAVVRLPKFKGRPTPLRVNCRTPEQEAETKVQPTLDGVIVGGASIAGLVAAAVTAGVAASKDNWSFGANEVPLWIELED